MDTKYLSRDEILSANDIHIEELPVPEWGGVIFVKTLSADERDQLEASIMEMSTEGKPKKMKLEHLRSNMMVLGICDDKGEKLFTLADISKLGKKSAAAADRVVARIQAISAMSPADIEVLVSDLKNAQPAALPTA
jgi:hypothetical protein